MFLCRTVNTGYGLNVDAMLASVTREQFNEWIAMYRLEPWGDDWAQAGTVAAAISNSAGKVSTKDVSPADFIPSADHNEPIGLSDADMRAKYERQYGAK